MYPELNSGKIEGVGEIMETAREQKIVIVGLSDKADRYAFMAYQRLLQNGFENLTGVSPHKLALPKIEVYQKPESVEGPVHTITLYVGKKHSDEMMDKLLDLRPKRIIFNPGSENDQLEERAVKQGIEVVHGCTLVMLSTDQF